MRFQGREHTGAGIAVAVIDSGVDMNDARMIGATVRGWNLALGATGHALIGGEFSDLNGHGTDMAAAVRVFAKDADIVSVRIMDEHLRTTADLMAAGVETAYRSGARVILLSMGTPNMGKASLLRDTCALATEGGAMVVAAAHPQGERAYPADLPEAVGVAAHPDCPLEKTYFFASHRFPAKRWGHLSGKFLTTGHHRVQAQPGVFAGSGVAAAYIAGRMACLAEAMTDADPDAVIAALRNQAFVPEPQLGYV